jgi:hypothetical protein
MVAVVMMLVLPLTPSHQVKYWLNTVSLRRSKFIRLLLIGTKIDLITSDRESVLDRCRCCYTSN